MGYGCGRVVIDENKHEASWGARLIYEEVAQGSMGIVSNRQSGFGTPESEPIINDSLKKFYAAFRWTIENDYRWTGSSSGQNFVFRDGRVLIVASPQTSYGYLYITAVLEKRDHLYRTRVDTGETDCGNSDEIITRTLGSLLDDAEWGEKNKNRAFLAKTNKKIKEFKALFESPARQYDGDMV